MPPPLACDRCSLNCPYSKPGYECAFAAAIKKPIRSREDVIAFLKEMLEVSGERIRFGVISERFSGALDPGVTEMIKQAGFLAKQTHEAVGNSDRPKSILNIIFSGDTERIPIRSFDAELMDEKKIAFG